VTITVRAVEQSDFETWLPLWRGYNASGATVLPDEITRRTWARFFDGYEPVHALVAEDKGRLVGLTHYLFHRSTSVIGPVCYLQDLFTAEDSRGRGVARALITAVYDSAARAGAERVYWHTHETNTTGLRLYDRIAERSDLVVYRHDLPG
jgi:GNAT superfamily N-acetyltransferase